MKIGIIGLGLIGGSILKKLAGFGHELYAVTRSHETLRHVESLVKSCSDKYEILSNCEVVFVCTPIGKILETLDRLEGIVPESCVVTDVASVKEFVTKKKYSFKFIPSHPMAGTENSGYGASFPELFVGAKWVLTPYDCPIDACEVKILLELVEQMGAKSIIADAKEHDKAVAMISHLPMYISQCLYNAFKDNKLAMKLASSGFRDTTRLAMTDLTLACDMLSFNGKNIQEAQNVFISELENLKSENYLEKITEISSSRRKMYNSDGKNIV